jgi:hypothetical protein
VNARFVSSATEIEPRLDRRPRRHRQRLGVTALAETLSADGAALLKAVVRGIDVTSRVYRAAPVTPWYGRAWAGSGPRSKSDAA